MVLTEKVIQKLKPGAKREQYMDDSQSGFGLRVDADGRKSFFWYAKVNGKPRFRALGEFPVVTLKEARTAAQEWTGIAAAWKHAGYPEPDPFEKTPSAEPAGIPTVRDLIEAYIERHVREEANNPAQAEYEVRGLAKYFADWLDRPVDAITIKDTVALKEQILRNAKDSTHARSGGKYQANRVLERLRAIYNWSAKSEDGKTNFWPIERNPARDIKYFDEDDRERFLSPEELLRFDEQLEKEPSAELRDFLVLALGTGARKENILSAKWADISLDLANWHIPISKSGESYEVKLTARPLKVLERRRKETPTSEPFVFPAHSKSGHRVDLKKEWKRFRERAELPDFRMHDLRRTHGSYMAISGVSLQQIGAALGHRSLQSTEIYARLQQQAVTEAREAGERKMLELKAAAKKRAKLAARKPKLLEARRA